MVPIVHHESHLSMSRNRATLKTLVIIIIQKIHRVFHNNIFVVKTVHIPPNEKCMALLLAEERFLKIKQAIEEGQNQPEVMQELLLKLMDDLKILKGNQQEEKERAAQSFTPY
ncbi:hypothetical protein Tco_0097111 [Tanacetum coccineum]